jgi:hypothetical protein
LYDIGDKRIVPHANSRSPDALEALHELPYHNYLLRSLE